MFTGPKFLAYIQKPSPYYLCKILPDEKRAEMLQIVGKKRQIISHSNIVYKGVGEIMKKKEQQDILKYQNSFLWSPRFTPNRFVITFLIPGILVTLLLLYIHYIAQPKNMMRIKKSLGIRFAGAEANGRLNGWYDQYMKEDKVLKFEAHTLEDMERLYKEGMLAKNTEQMQKNIEKKRRKFVRGTKDFVLNEFKSN